MANKNKVGSVMVVGGGIAGMQSALDLAESGFKVYLVEDSPSIGGRMAQLDKTFPTNDCAMCTLSPKMVDAGRHVNIERLTYSDVVGVEGEPGHFSVTVREKARSVETGKCTGCGECTLHCPVRYKAYEPPVQVEAPFLPPEEREKVDALLNKYAYKPAPLLSVLQGVNDEFNYLPEGVLFYLSHLLRIPIAHIVSVASFYSLFSLKPRGKYVISVCQGTSCFVRGADQLMERMQDTLEVKLGEMTPDGKFTLEMVRCLGCCALAPVVKVGSRIHGGVKPKDVADILKGYRNGD
jgi:NADH:ubiquinone oxidoreductase subunit E/NAD-dependent dihydropyrimidine dehydrogenase PreA subunit